MIEKIDIASVGQILSSFRTGTSFESEIGIKEIAIKVNELVEVINKLTNIEDFKESKNEN